MGKLILKSKHKVLCGDSTDVLQVERLMAGEKADMVFTDPPYGDGHAGTDVDLSQSKIGKSIVTKVYKLKFDNDLSFWPNVVASIYGVLKPKATKLVFFKWKKWQEILEGSKVFGNPSAVCVWDRDEMAAATFRFNPCHEFVFHWGNLLDKHSKSNLSNVWRCKKERENKAMHPTVKPIEILEPAIEVCTDNNMIVLDPFLGSGSTLIACEKTNRKCYGMELDPNYVDVILNRYKKFSGKKAYLVSDQGLIDHDSL